MEQDKASRDLSPGIGSVTSGQPDMVERVARAICANSPGGFCRDVGGSLGCKNGRGVSPHWSNCVATPDQLSLSGTATAGRAAIAAMLEPTDGMFDAGEKAATRYSDRWMMSIANDVWEAMVSAAIPTQRAEVEK